MSEFDVHYHPARFMKVGFVGGGGEGNFFGAPHRTAVRMDGTAVLTAGALRSKPHDHLKEAARLGFKRGYPDYQTMMREEAALLFDEGIDYVTIVTRNDSHYDIAKAALLAGFPVLCEKPMTMSLVEAQDLMQVAKRLDLPFIVAYTYTGFPMVMLAKEMVRQGDIGEVRKVEAWYPQGWLADRTEDTGLQQAQWRVDPSRAGASGCGGDIGTHAYEFVRFVVGLTAKQVLAVNSRFVEGRLLDDDFLVTARLNNGGIATINASQVTVGFLNDCGFRVVGSCGTLHWSITEPNSLQLSENGGPVKTYRTGAGEDRLPTYLNGYTRLPGGHPEGFHEALANLHRTMQLQIRRRHGEDVPEPFKHPDVVDGAAGMAFIEAAVASSNKGGWSEVQQVD